jgi:hypothetical protein
MPSAGVLIGVAVALAVVYLAVRLVRSYFALRGARVVTCPENHRRAGVQLDARRAAVTGLYKGQELHLSACSRWPEKAGCGQECVAQIAQSGPDCLVNNILVRWYQGATCALCGKEIGEIDWTARKPALMTPEHMTIDWNMVPVEHLDEVLASHRPVCFACHLASTFVHDNPRLVVDRTHRAS